MAITDPTLPIFFRVAYGAKLTDKFVDKLIIEAKLKEVGVIMFDSLRSLHDADENNSQQMQTIMDLFKKITKENISDILNQALEE